MNKGILAGAVAYTLWGLFPLYLKLLQAVPPLQITAQRAVWSFVMLLALAAVLGELPSLKKALATRGHIRLVGIYLGLAFLLSVNWLIFVWAVSTNHTVEASLGYFINPLVNVLLGQIFLGERLRAGQWLAVGVAAGGVIYLTASSNSLPWIALALAISFGFYGLIKKLSPLGSLSGLTLETALMVPAALAYLGWLEAAGASRYGDVEPANVLLVVGLGAVTAAPLLLFAVAARHVPLWMLGLLQYISPTIQFLNGVLLFGEQFSTQRAVGFGLIWLALAVFSLEGIWRKRIHEMA